MARAERRQQTRQDEERGREEVGGWRLQVAGALIPPLQRALSRPGKSPIDQCNSIAVEILRGAGIFGEGRSWPRCRAVTQCHPAVTVRSFELSRRAFARSRRKSEPRRTDTRRTRFDFKLFGRMMSLPNTPLKRLPVTGGPCMARVEHVSRRWRLALLAGMVSLLSDAAVGGTNSWTPIGPNGGQVASLAPDPRGLPSAYPGTRGSGIFKTVNGAGRRAPRNTHICRTGSSPRAHYPHSSRPGIVAGRGSMGAVFA